MIMASNETRFYGLPNTSCHPLRQLFWRPGFANRVDLHGIGIAFKLCLDDAGDKFPVHDGWAAVGGQRPITPCGSGNAWEYGGAEWETRRPLKSYARNVNLFHCLPRYRLGSPDEGGGEF
jgi:hypothetical protein